MGALLRVLAGNVQALVESLPLRESKKYVVAVDNYFTYPKILKAIMQLGIVERHHRCQVQHFLLHE